MKAEHEEAIARVRGWSKIATGIGLVVLIAGCLMYLSLPPEIKSSEFLAGGVSMDEVGARGDAELHAIGCIMFGGVITAAGLQKVLGSSRSARRARAALLAERAAAVASGLQVPVRAATSPGPLTERLQALEELRRSGLISEDEYRDKRASLLQQL